MSWVIRDYHLFPVRYPPARPSLESCNLLFSNLSLLSPSSQSPSSLCNAISFSQPHAEDPKKIRRLRHDAFQEFLLNECGFTHSQLTAIVTKDPSLFRCKSIDRAQQAVQLLIDTGFTAPQVRKTILRNPPLLTLKVDQLKPKIELLTLTVGIHPQDLGNIISQHPRILGSSLSKNLVPKIASLMKLFGSSAKLSKAIKRAPVMLHCDGHVSENLEKRLKFMESIGLKQSEIKEILEKDSRFLVLSNEKIKKNMGFLTRVAGFSPNIVLKYPCFLGLSIERRMNPRHKVFEYLTEMSDAEDLPCSLPSMFSLSEERFAERFLNSPVLAELYEKYKGKSVDLDLS